MIISLEQYKEIKQIVSLNTQVRKLIEVGQNALPQIFAAEEKGKELLKELKLGEK